MLSTALVGFSALASNYDQIIVSSSVPLATAVTNTVGIRGEISTIYVDVPATKTGAVTVTSAEGFTILSTGDISADTVFVPQAQVYTTGGAASATNNMAPIVTVGDMSVVFDAADDTTGTNTFKITINYKR
jgi:hypothetical protein